MDLMNETLHRVHEVPVVPAEHLQVEAAAAAQNIVDLNQAQQDVVSGAEAFLQQAAADQEAAQAAKPELNQDLLRLLMLAGNKSIRELIAGSIALDVMGQKHGIEEFRFRAANTQTAQLEDARIRAEQADDDEDVRR